MGNVHLGRLLLLLVLFTDVSLSQLHNSLDSLGSTYSNLLVNKYGNGDVISSSSLDALVAQLSCDTKSCVLDKNTSTECVVSFILLIVLNDLLYI